ncbi:GDP-L-fucose synthase [Citrifermentans bemidjiense Bem]|uniref:GDP-L-fucose synthase n=1 Tax=Citrifermentans bemidjiense (strain ATCC BAA-1014 / DSM 16622 / JCM 12645 / Bem) TaxID=404380 RepID=B5EH53_CITBB|nr:GDP-L-fucose synthase [Citrifermentans bemidjiense]ACH38155.1 GDP-L-fucose synthase [Citrifermentans bemidjiense Bem]
MNTNAKIFVAGSKGLVGSALTRSLKSAGYRNLLTPEKERLDLTDHIGVKAFFESEKPEYVVLAAAKVGGIHANNTYPADFIYQNLVIQNNVIHQAHLNGVKRLLFLGSSCIYPKHAPQPMREEHLLTGPLEPTNEPYAIAKIAGLKMCEAYNRQYGTKFIAVMPTNLYGPGDNFDLTNSHVLPALIRKFHESREQRLPEVVVWGTGTPRREFLYVDDMADACLHLMNLPDSTITEELTAYPKPCFVNLGTGVDVTIRELAETVREVVGFEGRLAFDTNKPDGTPRKLQEVSRMKALGWEAKVTLKDGIAKSYQWFLENQGNIRK